MYFIDHGRNLKRRAIQQTVKRVVSAGQRGAHRLPLLLLHRDPSPFPPRP
jgi:hypothetical protein